MKAQEIKTIGFDAFGTLFKISPDLKMLNERTQGRATDLLDLYRRKLLAYSWLRTLFDRYVPFDRVSEQALTYALNSLEITDPELIPMFLSIYQNPTCYEGVPKLLSLLKSLGIQTYILSNGTPDMLEKGIQNAGIADLLDGFLSVDHVKYYKPRPEVYQLLVERSSCSTSDILFVSGNSWDICGASAFGLNTAWVNRSGLIFEELDQLPDFEITNISQVSDVVIK